MESSRGALRFSSDTAADAGAVARAQRGEQDDTGDAVVRRRVVSFGASNGDTATSDVASGRHLLGTRWNLPDLTPISHIGVGNSGASTDVAASVSVAPRTVAAHADTERIAIEEWYDWGSSDSGDDSGDDTLLLETITEAIFNEMWEDYIVDAVATAECNIIERCGLEVVVLMGYVADTITKSAPIDNAFEIVRPWGWDMSRTHGNGDGTGQIQHDSSRVFLTRCLGQVPSLDIHLDHQNRTWYLWNSIEVKSIRLDHSESVPDILSRSDTMR